MFDTGPALRSAQDEDLDAVAALVNASYRGEGGWTNETAFLHGPRTTADRLGRELSAQAGAVLLIQGDGAGANETLAGAVRLAPLGDGVWELSMLTIRPDLQDRKLGRSMLEAAEAAIAASGGRCIEITVLNIRSPLIAWYARRGYRQTGEVRLFPYQGSPFGTPTRDDLAFVVMRKACVRETAG